MSLRSKLNRLEALAGTASSVAASTEEPRPSIEELRRKMDALLGASSHSKDPEPTSDARSASGLDELPFGEVELSGQRIWQRLEPLRPSTRVGRGFVDAAGAAQPEFLALLGLDPTLAVCDPRRALYLDTETTGLGGAGTVAFLVGLCWFDDDQGWTIEQLLLPEPSAEKALLERVAQLVEGASMLVTFNGKSFDRPLLESRLLMNRLPSLAVRPHLDLLGVARRLHRRRLGSCRLVRLESEVLGWDRSEDDVPGFEIPARYSHFLRTGDGSVLRPVIDHNAWDVLTMAALVGLYGEPLPPLDSQDLIGLARTLRRAGDLTAAYEVAEAAWARGGGHEALLARGEIAKARGDRARALLDFEAVSAEVDDPRVRLELAKLYEHFVGNPASALAVAEAGTGESEEAWLKRVKRLERKARRGSSC